MKLSSVRIRDSTTVRSKLHVITVHQLKLQALVYDTLPSATAVFS